MTAMMEWSQGIGEPWLGTAIHAGHFLWTSQQHAKVGTVPRAAAETLGGGLPARMPPVPGMAPHCTGPGQLSPAAIPEGAWPVCTSVCGATPALGQGSWHTIPSASSSQMDRAGPSPPPLSRPGRPTHLQGRCRAWWAWLDVESTLFGCHPAARDRSVAWPAPRPHG